MSIERIYSGAGSGDAILNTDSFRNGKAIYIIAPNITDELEIDFYLQVDIGDQQRRLLTLTNDFRADTVRFFVIPEELINSNLDLYVAFSNTLGITIEIFVVLADITLESISDDLQEITNGIANIAEDTTTEEAIELIVHILTAISAGNPLPALPSGLGALSGAGQNVPLFGGVFSE